MPNILDLQNLPTDPMLDRNDGGEWGTTGSLEVCVKYHMDGFAD